MEMKKEEFIKLSIKYLSSEVTVEEEIQIELLLKNDKYKKLFNWLSIQWKKDDQEFDELDFNLSRGYNKLTRKIKRVEPSFRWVPEKAPQFRRSYSKIIVAASIIILTIISALSFYTLGIKMQDTTDIVFNEITTRSGQKSIVTLFDGTKVTLNASTTLKYPTHFGELYREVYLTGEAYFDVAHNAKKPFIVHFDKFTTTVLGTKFDICVFPDGNSIRVSLVEGKVKVSVDKNKGNSLDYYLNPEQQFVLDKTNGHKYVRNFNIVKEIGWKDNHFIFENEPLINVLSILERAYGVKLEVHKKYLKDYTLRANIDNEPFWAIVETIKYATGLDYEIVNENNVLKKIVFTNIKKKD